MVFGGGVYSKSRLRHAVGRLWVKSGDYYFAYNKEGLLSAKKYGYQLHPSFPSLEVYKSKTLFLAFASRLPNKERVDYADMLNKYGLTPENSD